MRYIDFPRNGSQCPDVAWLNNTKEKNVMVYSGFEIQEILIVSKKELSDMYKRLLWLAMLAMNSANITLFKNRPPYVWFDPGLAVSVQKELTKLHDDIQRRQKQVEDDPSCDITAIDMEYMLKISSGIWHIDGVIKSEFAKNVFAQDTVLVEETAPINTADIKQTVVSSNEATMLVFDSANKLLIKILQDVSNRRGKNHSSLLALEYAEEQYVLALAQCLAKAEVEFGAEASKTICDVYKALQFIEAQIEKRKSAPKETV